ncbi:MAG: hypothetical protein K2Y32_15030 [Candidatus Obscuribacterales bacterium]|nr:hypothetical protein [Candidatus Obscuribacterales bacterium]
MNKPFKLLVDVRIDTSTLRSDVEVYQGDDRQSCLAEWDRIKDEKVEAFSLCMGGAYLTSRYRNPRLCHGQGAGASVESIL